MTEDVQTPGPWHWRFIGTSGRWHLLGDDGKEFVSVGGSPDCPLSKDQQLIAAAPDLLAACEAARKAISDEFLYQTGQFCRPEREYPERGSVHHGQLEAQELIVSAIRKATSEDDS